MAQTHLESLYTEELYKIKSKILIVTPKSWTDVQESERVLLGKILGALKFSLSSVQIMNQEQFVAEDFKVYQPTCIIAFGAVLKNSTKMYEKLVDDGVAIVVAHGLEELDDVRKRNLWVTLKQVFQT